MADALDVKLGRIVGFSEEIGGMPAPMAVSREADFGVAFEKVEMPDIEPGSNDISATVFVTYELL
jgi:uncharacterized protein YggE